MFPHNSALNIELDFFYGYFSETLKDFYQNTGTLGKACLYTCLGKGKRIRPLLTLLSMENLNGSKLLGMRPAIALEMIHCYSLCHDDLPAMDNDDLRRGIPTTHKKFGEASAILAGDALLTDAFLILTSKKFPSLPQIPQHQLGTVIEEISTAAGSQGMVQGQQLDTEATGNAQNISLAHVSKIHAYKTGALISSAMAIGAWMATGSHEIKEKYRLAGAKLGTAFQIFDDLLDVEGTKESLGKTPGKDEAAHKLTFLSVMSQSDARELGEKLCCEAETLLRESAIHSKALFNLIQFLVTRDH